MRRQQHYEIWLRPVPPQTTAFAIRGALFELDKLVREGIPEAGLQATREFLLHYVDLWAQDPSERKRGKVSLFQIQNSSKSKLLLAFP